MEWLIVLGVLAVVVFVVYKKVSKERPEEDYFEIPDEVEPETPLPPDVPPVESAPRRTVG